LDRGIQEMDVADAILNEWRERGYRQELDVAVFLVLM